MSDQDENIFSKTEVTDQTTSTETQETATTGDTAQNETTYADLLKSITREDGTQKYASVEDVFKALKASQEFIDTLKTENSTFKAELEKRKNAEELFEKINASKQEETTNSSTVDESTLVDKIMELVPEVIQRNEAAKTSKANLDSVVNTLREVYGDNADKEFYGKAKELGLSTEKMNELAATSPTAVFKMLGVSTNKQSQSSMNSDINTAALIQNQQKEKASLKIPTGATGRDFAELWKKAGERVTTDN